MQRYTQPRARKAFVKVRADHDIGGKITPLKFREAEGETYLIDRITDVRPAASERTGGHGMRYTCRVQGKQIYLFHDRDIWFIEADWS